MHLALVLCVCLVSSDSSPSPAPSKVDRVSARVFSSGEGKYKLREMLKGMKRDIVTPVASKKTKYGDLGYPVSRFSTAAGMEMRTCALRLGADDVSYTAPASAGCYLQLSYPGEGAIRSSDTFQLTQGEVAEKKLRPCGDRGVGVVGAEITCYNDEKQHMEVICSTTSSHECHVEGGDDGCVKVGGICVPTFVVLTVCGGVIAVILLIVMYKALMARCAAPVTNVTIQNEIPGSPVVTGTPVEMQALNTEHGEDEDIAGTEREKFVDTLTAAQRRTFRNVMKREAALWKAAVTVGEMLAFCVIQLTSLTSFGLLPGALAQTCDGGFTSAYTRVDSVTTYGMSAIPYEPGHLVQCAKSSNAQNESVDFTFDVYPPSGLYDLTFTGWGGEVYMEDVFVQGNSGAAINDRSQLLHLKEVCYSNYGASICAPADITADVKTKDIKAMPDAWWGGFFKTKGYGDDDHSVHLYVVRSVLPSATAYAAGLTDQYVKTKEYVGEVVTVSTVNVSCIVKASGHADWTQVTLVSPSLSTEVSMCGVVMKVGVAEVLKPVRPMLVSVVTRGSKTDGSKDGVRVQGAYEPQIAEVYTCGTDPQTLAVNGDAPVGRYCLIDPQKVTPPGSDFYDPLGIKGIELGLDWVGYDGVSFRLTTDCHGGFLPGRDDCVEVELDNVAPSLLVESAFPLHPYAIPVAFTPTNVSLAGALFNTPGWALTVVLCGDSNGGQLAVQVDKPLLLELSQGSVLTKSGHGCYNIPARAHGSGSVTLWLGSTNIPAQLNLTLTEYVPQTTSSGSSANGKDVDESMSGWWTRISDAWSHGSFFPQLLFEVVVPIALCILVYHFVIVRRMHGYADHVDK
eukprot:TRINITY_DN3200_c0_g2_i1.p1 TRINITY_DN3200_c0_g2~~TRINITY_DN3200_c0_g2_i1.p1  ORF type:complete len:850 (+),score=16.72 TRINITY_DN3200_c0_g2_i1:238-2787(+)